MIRLLLISLLIVGCGGGGSSSKHNSDLQEEEIIADEVYTPSLFGCLANERNCSDADVDLNAPVRWAADNGISIVYIRWFGCADEISAKYAFDRGVTIICLAGSGGMLITDNSPYTITVGSLNEASNYGPGVDYVLGAHGTVHSGIWATALVATGQPLGDFEFSGYVKMQLPAKTVMIVDNGFDSVRPLYVLYKNTVLAGKVTGDYGVKALNELALWVDVEVIGYVPFNTLPKEPRIDGWEIL